jgi:hypothetical protein
LPIPLAIRTKSLQSNKHVAVDSCASQIPLSQESKGDKVGLADGELVGDAVVGCAVGEVLGFLEGDDVGLKEGEPTGLVDGDDVG